MKKLGTLLLTGGILLALASPAYAQQPAGTEAIGVGTPALVAAAEEQAEAAALSATNGVVASGNCGAERDGSNLTWVLDNAGTLTISGNGEMAGFSSCTDAPWYSYSGDITKIVIESGVTKVGQSAFEKCDKLASIVVPESVTSFEPAALSRGNELQTAGPIGSGCDYEFGWKDSIPDTAFDSCDNLEQVTIPKSVTSIGAYAFDDCRSLTEIAIPDNVNYIGPGAFDHCENLTSITIPEGVVSIEYNTFFDCSKLTSVTIPKTVTSIGYDAFFDCSSLTDIYYSGSEAQWKDVVIDDYGNDKLMNALIHFSGSGSTGGSTSGGSSSSSGSSGGGGGCYVATAVYGSYDCPEVWTLRRYRDYELSQTAAGRAFIRTYYAVSPTIVEHFGEEEWFQDMWRGPLDKMVSNLQAKGYESTPYEDIAW